MACILKAADDSGKGVVVFTTQERDRAIRADSGLERRVRDLKDRWLIGLHHNWHDESFAYDDLFDFSMAGEGDLVERDGREFPLITVDACNFVPESFTEEGGDRFWDILYVARPVFFKGFREFFLSIRALYDSGQRPRVLCICPMPPYDEADADTVFYDVRDFYEELFSEEERERFDLLTLDYDYPFPFSLEALAHFYRSSKVFVHFAPDERRCRVAAYAWTTGMPVVAMAAVGSLLPPELQRPPHFYEATSYETFHEQIAEALSAPPADHSELRSLFLESETGDELRRQLAASFPDAGLEAGDYALDGLGIRLGRHHSLGGEFANSVPMPVDKLVGLLAKDEPAVRAAVSDESDPERALAGDESSAAGPLKRLSKALGRG